MIYLHLEGIPISSNHAYFNNKGGGRTITTKGEKYINETKTTFAQKFHREMRFFKKDAPYLLMVRLYFETIENTGWKSGNAANRYKTIDVSNRLKLLEDALKAAAGIDDAQNLRVILDKQQGKERTQIWVWNLEEEETPFDVGFNCL